MGPAVVDVKSECSLVMHYRLFGYHLSSNKRQRNLYGPFSLREQDLLLPAKRRQTLGNRQCFRAQVLKSFWQAKTSSLTTRLTARAALPAFAQVSNEPPIDSD